MVFLGSFTAATVTVAGTTQTQSYTHTNGYHVACIVVTRAAIADCPTGVTFDGVAMTDSGTYTDSLYTTKLWTYMVPITKASGAYDVVITMPSSGKGLRYYISEYDDVRNSFSLSSASVAFTASPVTFTATTTALDSWLLVYGFFTSLGKSCNGTSDGTVRQTGPSFWVDSGADEGAAGSKSINITSASAPAGNVHYIIVELIRETSHTISATDASAASDSLSNAPSPKYAENATFLDSARNTLSTFFSSVVSFVERNALAVSTAFSDSFSSSDAAPVFGVNKYVAETPLFTDSFGSITASLHFSDAISFIEHAPRTDGVWSDRQAISTSFSGRTSPSTSFSDRSKPSTSFTNRSAPSSSWSNRTPPTTPWS